MVRQPDLYSNWSIHTHLPSLHRLDGLDGLDVTGVDSMADDARKYQGLWTKSLDSEEISSKVSIFTTHIGRAGSE